MLKRWRYWRAVEVISRFPEHYQKYLFEMQNKPPEPVHYYPEPGSYKKIPSTGEIQRIENRPIPLLFPKECHEGLWGGEAIIRGFTKQPRIRRVPKFWIPVLKRAFVYSEILDKTMSVIVTDRTLELIDKASGFDYYILKTHPVDLRSQLAMNIRRKMILALLRKEIYNDNKEKQNEIYEKYKEFVIPEEEAEWVGLPLLDAIKKQLAIEEERDKPVPFKIKFRKEFIQSLRETKENEDITQEKSPSLLDRLNPFAKATSSKTS